MQTSHFIASNLDVMRPECPKCGTRMWLARIEPDEPGCERRKYECPECDHELVEVAKYK